LPPDLDPDDAGDFVPISDQPEAVPTGRRAFLYARLASSVLRHDPEMDGQALPDFDSTDDSPADDLDAIASRLTTPFELFHGVKPDYRVLFPFGAVGYYRKPLEASSKKRSKFKSQTAAGIALGRSDFTNRMVCWDPDTSKFSTGPDDPMYPSDALLRCDPLEPITPHWVRDNSKVTIAVDNFRRQGYLILNDRQQWAFLQRDLKAQETFCYTIPGLQTTWKGRILEGSLKVSWPSPPRAYHVSASAMNLGCPRSFRHSMKKDYTDKQVWLDSYGEEYGGLREQETFTVITQAKYKNRYSHITVLPRMVVQTIKHDEVGNPVRAKTRIVALGNYETTPWKKSECHAPALQKSSSRLLTSMAVKMGRIEKQGDCKNAFLHAFLPDDEIVIVEPPHGCPLSKPGDLWLLKKTLYGLRRSPFHGYQSFLKALAAIGLFPCPHDPCVFTGTPLKGLPPIYLGVYVDNFKYFSASDEVERYLERELGSRLAVDFMGNVTWYLGCRYEAC
jgi:hypothetical protein